jgi:hypothetical protein
MPEGVPLVAAMRTGLDGKSSWVNTASSLKTSLPELVADRIHKFHATDARKSHSWKLCVLMP